MELIEFKIAVGSRTPDDRLLLALFDGLKADRAAHACLALLLCDEDGARALRRTLDGVLNSPRL